MKTKHIDLITLALVAVALLFTATTGAAAKKHEHDYQTQWCGEHQGETEVPLPDRTRADCLTATHAIEVDFSKKWAEAIGQSLSYSLLTGKKPGIVLIVEKKKHRKHWQKLQRIISQSCLQIDTWCIGKGCPQ